MNVRQDKSGGGLPITRIETISAGTIDLLRVGYAGLNPQDCHQWMLESGDILFSHINSAELVGKCAVYRGVPEKLVHGMNLLCLRPNRSLLDSNYAQWLIRSAGFRGRLSNFINKAVNQASVSIGNLITISVTVPPLEEQRRIAAILDKADALRQKRRTALQKLDSLTQSIFLDMFGDPVTNSKGWRLIPIEEIGTVVTGNTPSREHPEYFGDTIEWVKSDNLNTPHYYITRSAEGLSEIGRTVARTAPSSSILVTCIAGSPSCIGNAAMTDREVAFNQQINALIPKEGDPHFVYAEILLAKKRIQGASTNGMKGMVSKSRFEKILLPFPPIEMQQSFARRSLDLQKMQAMSSSSLDMFENLFDTLQNRAFRGEL